MKNCERCKLKESCKRYLEIKNEDIINKINKEGLICEVCKKIKEDVRFESSFEGFICDECLFEVKNGKERT